MTINIPSSKIARSNSYLEELDETTLSNLCHQLTHDIGNPLTAIISYSSILEQAEHYSIALDKVANYSLNISKEAWRVSRLMEKFLLLVSRKETRNLFSISELKKRVETRYANRYELAEMTLHFNGFNEDITIQADLDQCCSIICEIGNNALSAQKKLSSSEERNQIFQLELSFSLQEQYLVLEGKNPTPTHSKDLSSLLKVGEHEFSGGKDTLGIGLSAITCSMKRWNGFLEIEEVIIENTTYFITRLFFPLVSKE
jgi:light-regulated signal transduction histidine kinase (bacteriophytochrome)